MNTLLENLLNKYKGKLPKDYILAISDLSENHVNRRFLNDSDAHAQLLIECMIGSASETDEVRIYSGELKDKCYADILGITLGKVRILVDDIKVGKDVVGNLKEGQKNKILILPVAAKYPNHFYTVGNKSFRYELDHGLATAVANFNEPETAEKLNDLFDEMWRTAVAAAGPGSAELIATDHGNEREVVSTPLHA